MKKNIVGLAIAATMCCGVADAGAAVITTTASGINGYQWLSFDETWDMSRDDVEANLLGAGHALSEYRYASRLETELLLDSYYTAGSGDLHDDNVDTGSMTDTFDMANAFMNDFRIGISNTSASTGIKTEYSAFYYGLDSETLDKDESMYGIVGRRTGDANYDSQGEVRAEFGTDSSQLYSDLGKIDDTFQAPYLGSLLVKAPAPTPSAVPEPSTIFLFGTGMAGLIGSRLNKKNKKK